MKSTKMSGVIAFSALVLGMAVSATASTITFSTSDGTKVNGNLPVSAEVTLTTLTNQISVTINNLQTKISNIDQTISGVSFALNNLKTSTTISSSAGLERTVNSNRTFIDGAVVPTGWIILLDGQSMQLMLPDGFNKHTIIGPASGTKYTNADSTIAGSASDNPFLFGPVTFVIPIAGVTPSTTVDWATFHFGNCAEYVQACNVLVPEPGTLTLAGMAVVCGAVLVRRRAANAKRDLK
jgi:hypothetical protein